jgi:hypothetical protein
MQENSNISIHKTIIGFSIEFAIRPPKTGSTGNDQSGMKAHSPKNLDSRPPPPMTGVSEKISYHNVTGTVVTNTPSVDVDHRFIALIRSEKAG